MQHTKRNLLSLFSVILFIVFALASKVNKIHVGAFKYNNIVEEKSDKGNYIEKADGEKIYGDKIKWKTGILTKNQIQIDDQKFKISEVKGYRTGDTYYRKFGNDFIKRIVHGKKVNVYVQFSEVTTTTTDHSGFTHTSTHTRADQYAQMGDDGPLFVIADQKDIKKIVSDCPLAMELIDMKDSKIRKAIRKDRNYLNNIFDIYNNDCKKAKP